MIPFQMFAFLVREMFRLYEIDRTGMFYTKAIAVVLEKRYVVGKTLDGNNQVLAGFVDNDRPWAPKAVAVLHREHGNWDVHEFVRTMAHELWHCKQMLSANNPTQLKNLFNKLTEDVHEMQEEWAYKQATHGLYQPAVFNSEYEAYLMESMFHRWYWNEIVELEQAISSWTLEQVRENLLAGGLDAVWEAMPALNMADHNVS